LGNKIETFCAIVEELFIVGGGLFVVRGSLSVAFNLKPEIHSEYSRGDREERRDMLDVRKHPGDLGGATSGKFVNLLRRLMRHVARASSGPRPVSFLNTLYIRYGVCLDERVERVSESTPWHRNETWNKSK